MADQYVDLNLGNDGNAGTSWGTGNAVAAVAQGLTNASAGDKVYVRSYGPDDPYIITADLVPNGEEIIGCVGADSGTDPGQYVVVWITSVTANVDIFDTGNAAIWRYICASSTGTAGVGWNLDGTTSVTLDHCRSESCTSYGFYSNKTGGTVTVRNCEGWADGAAWYFLGAGCLVDLAGFVSFSVGAYGVMLSSALNAESASLRQMIIIQSVTAPVFIGAIGDMAPGSPDFNAFDTAAGAASYANSPPSVTPANDFYSITEADWLPHATLGILRCPIDYPGKGQGWPNGYRREDVGIDGEYITSVNPEWSSYCTSSAVGSNDSLRFFTGDTGSAIYRAQLKFYIAGCISPSAAIRQGWLNLTCFQVGNASARFIFKTYGSDGYSNDPEQDPIATRFANSNAGSVLTPSIDIDGAEGTVFTVCLNSPSTLSEILGRGRRLSLAMIEDGENHVGGYWYGYGSVTPTKRPRLLLVYAPPLLSKNGGEAGYLATQVRDLATVLASELT